MVLARSSGSRQYSDLQIVGAGASGTRLRCRTIRSERDTFTSSLPWRRRSKGGVRQ
jgi:hypothetical protein